MRAKSIVLPGEDACIYSARRDRWFAELQPKTDVEAFLAGRAVDLSWQLDRLKLAIAHADLRVGGLSLDAQVDEVDAVT